ncbi:MAG TPA: fluoride efflux transporter CrcB [Thermoanaerobaculia bacterium]|nr:fluoride efflux transporter CrcB [Thermoanaerobaculia bacterium]
MTRLLLIGLGGAIGSIARYLIVVWTAGAFGSSFPLGTLLVNIAGSFLLGFVMHFGTATELLSANTRLALTTGALGGFTTYSTFNFETTDYFRSGAWLYGTLNVFLTVAGCLAAGVLGLAAARLIAGR